MNASFLKVIPIRLCIFIVLCWMTLGFVSGQQTTDTGFANHDSLPGKCFISPLLHDYLLTKRDGDKIKVILSFKNQTGLMDKAYRNGIDLTTDSRLLRPGFMICSLTKKDITLLSTFSEVHAIELQRSAQPELKQEGLDLTLNEINLLHARRPELRGTGLLLSIKEYAFDSTDIDFKGRHVESIVQNHVDIHTTAMASISGGGGNSDPSALGVAPDVSLTSSDFSVLLPDPDSIFTSFGISVQNHSYGSGIENYYGMETVAYDEFCNRLPNILHVFAAGNQENNSSTTGTYKLLNGWANVSGQYKQSKNTMSVGSVDSMDVRVHFSSSGPAYDGRIKPEVVAYGPGGTSNATSLLTGTSILLQQAYRQLHNGEYPTSSLLKAILINTAKDLDTPGPDFRKGFGSIRAFQALKTIEENQILEDSIQQGGHKDFILPFPANTSNLSITIVWNDPAAAMDAKKALVNDLDLELIQNSTLNIFYPWILNSKPNIDSLSLPAKHGVDSLNNVERIDVITPTAGDYTIRISGEKMKTMNQDFSLTWCITPSEQFSWTFPTASDVLKGSTAYQLRWKSNASLNGKLEYKSTKSSEWEMIADGIEAPAEKWRWTTPSENGLYQLRWTSQDSIYTTDTFVVSSQLLPTVGLVCPDSILIYWHPIPGADGYEILLLGERHLEHDGETTDTVYVFHNITSHPTLFAVVPLFDHHRGLASATYNYKNLDVSCYLNNFYLKEIKDGKGLFQVDIGLLINVKAIHLQEYSKLGFSDVAVTSPVTQLSNVMEGNPLLQGVNYYRAVLEFISGYTIKSDTEKVYFLKDAPVIVFPNPAYSGDELHFLSRSVETFDLKIMDMTGREIKNIHYAENPEIFSLPNLPSGVYIAAFYFESGEIEEQRFMVR